MEDFRPPAGMGREIAAIEVDSLILARAQLATFQSRQDATASAVKECPELPWAKIFAALEAAGLVAFMGSK